jgi:hypothetical protein
MIIPVVTEDTGIVPKILKRNLVAIPGRQTFISVECSLEEIVV